MNPNLVSPPSYLLNVPSCLLTDYLYLCPVDVFQSHFHSLEVLPILSFSLPWRKSVGRMLNKRGGLKWQWELKVNTRGWSVTVNPLHHIWPPLWLLVLSLSPGGRWLTVVLFAMRVFMKINTFVDICVQVRAHWLYTNMGAPLKGKFESFFILHSFIDLWGNVSFFLQKKVTKSPF